MVYRTLIALLIALLPASAWGQATAQRQQAAFAGVFAGGSGSPNAYTMVRPTPLGWANTPGFRVCGAFPIKNTQVATVSVENKTALPVHVQTTTVEVPLAGGELVGTRCLAVNAAGDAFVMTEVAGGVLFNQTPHTVTQTEWAYGEQFVYSANGTLSLPSAATMAAQGSIIIQTLPGATVTLEPVDTASDGINGGAPGASVEILPNSTTMVTTSGAAGMMAYRVPLPSSGGGPVAQAPTITSPNVRNSEVGTSFFYKIEVDNPAGGLVLFAAPALTATFPDLSLDPIAGEITGTPTTAGTHVVELQAQGFGGTGHMDLTINIYTPGTVIPGTCPESQAWFDRVGAAGITLNGTHHDAYDELICRLKTDGVWDKLDVLYVFATDSTTDALMNLKSTNYTGTPSAAPNAPTFIADEGFHGVSGSTSVYINTHYNPSTPGQNWQLYSASVSAWIIAGARSLTGAGNVFGAYDGTNYMALNPLRAETPPDQALAAVNSTASASTTTRSLGPTGFYFAQRFGALPANVEIRRYGESLDMLNAGSAGAVLNRDVYVLAYNNNGTAGSGSASTVSAITFGGSLSSANVSSTPGPSGNPTGSGLTNRLCAYLSKVRNTPGSCPVIP